MTMDTECSSIGKVCEGGDDSLLEPEGDIWDTADGALLLGFLLGFLLVPRFSLSLG